jgi:hypothetical protein
MTQKHNVEVNEFNDERVGLTHRVFRWTKSLGTRQTICFMSPRVKAPSRFTNTPNSNCYNLYEDILGTVIVWNRTQPATIWQWDRPMLWWLFGMSRPVFVYAHFRNLGKMVYIGIATSPLTFSFSTQAGRYERSALVTMDSILPLLLKIALLTL